MDEILVPDTIRRIATIQQDYTIWQTLSQTSKNMNAVLKGLGKTLAIPCYSGVFKRRTCRKKILERKNMIPDKWTGINFLLTRSLTQDPRTVMQYEFDDHDIKRALCGRNTYNCEGFLYDVVYEILFSDGVRVEGYSNDGNNAWFHKETLFIDFCNDGPIMLTVKLGKRSEENFIHTILFWIYEHERVTLEVEDKSIKWFDGYGRETKSFQKLKSRFANQLTPVFSVSNILDIIKHIEQSGFSDNVLGGITKILQKLKFPKLVLSKIKNMDDQNSKLITSIWETSKI